MSSWDGKAINGADLQADLQAVAVEIKKRGLGEVVAESLVEIDGRLKALEDAGVNIGDVVADSVNTQVLKVKGVDASPSDHTHQVKINGYTKTVPKTGGTPVDLGTYVTPTGDGTNVTTTPTSESSYTKPTSATKLSVLFGKLFYFVSRLRTSVRAVSSASDTEFPSEKAVATAIDDKVKGVGDIGGMSSDSTHAYTGEAVCEKIVESVTGNVGGYIGEKTVAQMNGYTQPKMGDSAIVTDTGTITVGSTSCVISTAPSEVRWTTDGYWGVTSSGYVRDTKVATTSALGLVKLSNSDGGVSLDSNKRMVVNGWDGKQDSLPTNTTPSETYSINVSGSAASTAKTSLGQVNTLPVASMVSSDLKAGTFLLKATSDGGSPYVFGNVTIPNGQWYRFVVNGESSSYCTITLDVVAGGGSTPFGTFKLLVDSGIVKNVVRVPYETTTSAVGGSSTPVYVDSNGEFKECTPSGMSVGYASAAEPGSALAQAIAPDADALYLTYNTQGQATTQYNNAVAAYAAHKKIYCVWGGSVSGRNYEKKIPLSYVLYESNGTDIFRFYFNDSIDGMQSANDEGLQHHIWLGSDGNGNYVWSDDSRTGAYTYPYYADNAGSANTANSATNATNDHGGAKIRDAYLHGISAGTPSSVADSDHVDGVINIEPVTDANGFISAQVNLMRVPITHVYRKSVSSVVAVKKNGTEQMPSNEARVSSDSTKQYGYNGFTVLGHQNPLAEASRDRVFGIGETTSNYLYELDFDFEATPINFEYGSLSTPSIFNLIFALKWADNAFIYGFAYDDSGIFSTATMTLPAYTDGSPSYGHMHMVGLMPSNTGYRRIFLGAVNDSWIQGYVKVKIHNLQQKWITRATEYF